jgi:NADH dehydrogenase
MKIAVTGAFSYTGKYVTQRLLERGEQVITLTGHPDRPDPFSGKVKALPLDFEGSSLRTSLEGMDVLVNTYWVRFDRRGNTQPRAVENTGRLIASARAAGVGRIIHVSVTNPTADSPLPYFSGKAANERAVKDSGLGFAILRPTLIVGVEDILINNIAFLLRRLPLFGLPGDGRYPVQPVDVEDLADLMVEAVYARDNYTIDAVGPDVFSFREMVALIGEKIGARRPLLSVPPGLALAAARSIGLVLGDVLLTPEEIDGLMAGLLVSNEPPSGRRRLVDWLDVHGSQLGLSYASELKRHFL